MTMHLVPDRGDLSARRLSVFLVLGVLLIVGGLGEGWHGLLYILVGAVLVTVNGSVLAKRIVRRNR